MQDENRRWHEWNCRGIPVTCDRGFINPWRTLAAAQVDASTYPHASNALAYFLAGGQAICPDGKVFGGDEDVVEKIIAFW